MKYTFEWTDELVEKYRKYMSETIGGTMKEFKRKKRGWKILKFVGVHSTSQFWELQKDGKYSDGEESISLMDIMPTMSRCDKDIHTVMRLSDGCIFAIGDMVSLGKVDFKIKGFTVYDDGSMDAEDYERYSSSLHWNSGSITKIKKYEEVEL